RRTQHREVEHLLGLTTHHATREIRIARTITMNGRREVHVIQRSTAIARRDGHIYHRRVTTEHRATLSTAGDEHAHTGKPTTRLCPGHCGRLPPGALERRLQSRRGQR